MKIKIPRRFTNFPLNNNEIKIQLHIFCDASSNAFAAVAYLRFEYQNKIECTLINSKARVAPLKPVSFPRLDLQAALIGARMGRYIGDSLDLKIDATYF